ncbi:MICOS complex subunit MIC19-like [Ornithodoros turicata]|uniref:Putative head-elevated expression protein n=1 Tax=Ornithodoros turicata TaxID=34597 RepID=A0A2R5L4Y4_9ACAR
MGSSGSTRRVTIVNEHSPDVIKISDAVAKRLKGDTEPITSSASRTEVSRPYDSRAGDSLEARRLHYEDIRKVDSVWKERLDEVERQNQELYKLATDKFAGAVDEVGTKYVKHKCVPVCEAAQKKVLECYERNQKQPLNCSKLVDAFTRCVHQARKDIIAQ